MVTAKMSLTPIPLHLSAAILRSIPGGFHRWFFRVHPGLFPNATRYRYIEHLRLHSAIFFSFLLLNPYCLWAGETGGVQLPSTAFPRFIGARNSSQVPDTLDLAERMKLSLNAITRCVDGPPPNSFPDTHYLCSHIIDMSSFPPKVLRNVDLYGKYMLGALLARMVTGSEDNIQVDNDWRKAWLEFQQINPVMSGPEGGRWLEWMAFNYQRESEPNKSAWSDLANRAIMRLNEASATFLEGSWIVTSDNIPDDGFASYNSALENSKKLPDLLAEAKSLHPNGFVASGNAWTLQGLSALYRETRNPAALKLASRIARYLKDYANIIAPDGKFLAEVPPGAVHWHHSFQAALACAEYGLVSGEREYLDFADATYRHALTFCSREAGFAPEYVYGCFPRTQDEDNTEACCCADLVQMALWISVAGVADYWDDVDRFLRNHISTLQLTDTFWFYNLPENRGKYAHPDPQVETLISPYVGQFGGWATANEWHDPRYGPGIMTCCVGNCTRAFYYVLSRMMDFSEGTLRIHLTLNAVSPWAEVKSYQPFEGRCEIMPKTKCEHILVRIPEWIVNNSDTICCSKDGKPYPIEWRGRYIDAGAGQPSQTISIQFPISVHAVKTDIGRRPYTLTIKGNTIVSIDPRGKRIPLYQREEYLSSVAPLVEVDRFLVNAID
jgi:hypothetical protein